MEKHENGSDPYFEQLNLILDQVNEINARLEELTEKINDISLTSEGFGYTEPES